MPLTGILGGTFDPIHFGHLGLAGDVARQLGMKEVRFIPSGLPWHRGVPGATPAQRLEMVRLALAGNPLFRLDGREVIGNAPGYTVETLGALRREEGAQPPLCLILGADAFLGLPTWQRWRELFGLAHFAVAIRPGFSLAAAHLEDSLRAEIATRMTDDPVDLQQVPAGRVITCTITPRDISATRIRAAFRKGETPRDLLPQVVLDYIQAHKLYR